MRPWIELPREEAYLFNPPFCGLLQTTAIAEYGTMPVPVAFIILPIVLHKRTRDQLPRDTRTTFVTWIQDNPETRIGFAERVAALKPHSRRGLIYALNQELIHVATDGNLAGPADGRLYGQADRALSDEAQACVRRARFVGRWFARVGAATTIMALWGIRP